MKSKRKIDTKAIQQFFIDHTEKIVIGAVGLMFLYFAYSAIALQVNDSYKKVPEDLKQAVTKAQATIAAGPRNITAVGVTPIRPYAEEIDHFKRPLEANNYRFDKALIVAPVGQRRLRGTPTVIAVQKLRAVPGRGALVGKDSNPVGQRWVVVTGLVPYEEQLAEYKKMFQDANSQSDHDVPEYVGFLVQRGEVVPGAAEPAWEPWVMFSNNTTLVNRLQNWNVSGQEVVDIANTQSSLTSPLPQAINQWSDDVACPPDIKLLSPEESGQGQAAAGGAFPQRGPSARFGPDPMGGQMPYRGQVAPGRVPGQGVGPGARPGGDQAGSELIGNGPGAPSPKPEEAANKPQETPKYFLLRYFDFDVAPGKQYAYKVFPILMNPNHYVEGKELMDQGQQQQPFLGLDAKQIHADPISGKVAGWQTVATYWSPASRPVKVPGDMRMLAGPVEPPKPNNPTTEITGDARILRWDEKTGDSMNGVLAERFRGMVLDSPSLIMQPNRTSVPVSTGCLLADLTGGEPLSPRDKERIHSPGMMLVLDDAGNLVIHDEMAETADWLAETKLPEARQAPPPGERRQPMGPGRGPGFMRGRAAGPSNDSALPDNMRGR